MNLITNNQLSEKIQISKPTIRKYRNEGMPYIQIGEKIIRYDLTEVENWLKQNREGNASK